MAWSWTLTTSDGSASFGDNNDPVVIQNWSVEPGSFRVDDSERPRRDGLSFGADYRSGQVVSFDMWVRGESEAEARGVLAEFTGLWRNDGGRFRAGAVAELRHPDGRSVLGRPRGFSADAQRIHRGYATIAADFECVDDLWYGPERVTSIGFVPPVSGGLVFPAVAPFTFDGGPTVRNASVLVEGDVDTWPVFEIQGPVTNPEIDVPGVGRLVFDVSLAFDQVLLVDTRPSARYVLRNGAPYPGALSASGSRLSDMSLGSGAHTVLLRGYDPTGTAVLRVRTRPAFASF